ncbi:Ribosomal protein L32p [Moorella glycerini]|uniref:Large ribosomal subunit protein bL32 n=2 Tax=Neomoorella TaxID=44260 RepID=A0A9X7J5X9_9FIRM|nr:MULTISPECIES: 50S ribosomal protein L32 [Moorella]KYH32492.1 50S ribosomal protein L32 [Moorella mulderi DSM 14980]PRR76025.1 50S ribosomal protein L32 [Moorella stamsii]CEP68369.1 Ribosomal protein L32p [Moorella glycerini]
MGVPKRRVSKARKNKRRSIWSQMAPPSLVECPQCHQLKLNHRVCPKCGYYKGREVIKVAES